MCNLGVHWIDLYRWLLADEVVEVMGKTVRVNEQYDIEDNCLCAFDILSRNRSRPRHQLHRAGLLPFWP